MSSQSNTSSSSETPPSSPSTSQTCLQSTDNKPIELTQEEKSLQVLMVNFSQKKAADHQMIINELAEKKKQIDPDDGELRRIKPLFKEWLELRCDNDLPLKPPSMSMELKERSKQLVGYIDEYIGSLKQNAIVTDYYYGFVEWLKIQIYDTNAKIQKEERFIPYVDPPSRRGDGGRSRGAGQAVQAGQFGGQSPASSAITISSNRRNDPKSSTPGGTSASTHFTPPSASSSSSKSSKASDASTNQKRFTPVDLRSNKSTHSGATNNSTNTKNSTMSKNVTNSKNSTTPTTSSKTPKSSTTPSSSSTTPSPTPNSTPTSSTPTSSTPTTSKNPNSKNDNIPNAGNKKTNKKK
ncbi:hypothetical protein RDWZM_004235 [Blomia tropicalis]|uniref:Uncharacterized protein n=1 Tax=Blomia tropicalis TaxID=40697 RepID=A0A9Q0MGQ7_BLOTA|nr:hypothetical protein RDWZM_004235 [Blomia tropicalis]